MSMTNQERRTILLQQHASLRKKIARTRAAARNTLRGAAADGLRRAVQALKTDLFAHLAVEEELIGPILLKLDAWGAVRFELLLTEHAHQRAALSAWARGSEDPRGDAERTLLLCHELLTDLEFEEKELFNETLLRDDCILLDASDA